MSQTLTDIAQQLRQANKKVQLIYAFNGTGKTRLSRAFKGLIAPKVEGEDAQPSDLADKKVLYYIVQQPIHITFSQKNRKRLLFLRPRYFL